LTLNLDLQPSYVELNPNLDPTHRSFTPNTLTLERSDDSNLPRSEYLLTHPSLLAAKELVPPDLYRAILRVPQDGETFAGISLSFPEYTPYVKCQLVLQVIGSKIQHLAWELFGTVVEVEGGIRYIQLPDGNRIIGSDCSLTRCQMGAILPVFGEPVTEAIMASAVYQGDVANGHERTSAVQMTISSQSNEAGLLMLIVELRKGTEIKLLLGL
jgi:hypothetical protein